MIEFDLITQVEKEVDVIGRHANYDRINKIEITADPRDTVLMCSICRPILKNVRVEHSELICPIRNSRYCSTCAKYGHLTKACPAKPSRYFTEPIYLEQLISPSDLKEFGITTRTPLPISRNEEEPQLLEIHDSDKAIAAYLAARSIKMIKGYTKRRMLEEYAETIHKRVVYIK